jgi:hypothetical protein
MGDSGEEALERDAPLEVSITDELGSGTFGL